MRHATATRSIPKPKTAGGRPASAATAHVSLVASAGRCPCGGGCPSCSLPGSVHETLRSAGQPLEQPARTAMEQRFGDDFGAVRVHVGPLATRAASALGALAFTVGKHVVFGSGTYDAPPLGAGVLLAHELAHVAQSGHVGRGRVGEIARPDHPAEHEADRLASRGGRASYIVRRPLLFRAVLPRPVARRTAAQILGAVGPPPIAGMTLFDFRSYTQQEADWFVEPTLAAGTTRDDLWNLLLRAERGPHILSGVGDMKVANLIAVPIADWPGLDAFCRGTHSSEHTVRIFPPFPPLLADRIALGKTLVGMEAVIDRRVLEVTTSDSQVRDIQTQNHLPRLTQYWNGYQPHLEENFAAAPGVRGPEVNRLIAFLNAIIPNGLAPLAPLRGANPNERWVRNLHRFPYLTLQRLVANLGITAGLRPLLLILHTGHDAPAAFQGNTTLIDNLIASPTNLVLMIEGATSLNALTARVPTITATWGQIVGGVRRINQLLIAGHGSPTTTTLAGTGAPIVQNGLVSYPEEALAVGDPNTQALLDALLSHMPPATARILYFGCLVGATHVPAGTAAAAIPGALAANQSLGAFTNARAVAAGIPPGRVLAARASVFAGDVAALTNAAGVLQVTYPRDPNAYGPANTYTATGLEPEGVLRAAVEVGAANLAQAKALLQARLAIAAGASWPDRITRLLVGLALPVPLAGPLDLQRVNELANTAEIPFLIFWPQFGWINVDGYKNRLNPQPFALQVYAGLAAQPEYTAPQPNGQQRLRLVVDQAWLDKIGVAHVPTLLAGIAANNLDASAFADFLDPPTLAPHGAALLPPAGVPTQAQIRLALAWLARDHNNVDVRNFLIAQVTHPLNAPPALTPAVSAEVQAAHRTDRDILDLLGFAPVAQGAPGVGGVAQPLANLALPGSGMRRRLVTGRPFLATVVGGPTSVRRAPSGGVPAFTVLPNGATVRVAGITGAFAAVDINGRLGFALAANLSPPPP